MKKSCILFAIISVFSIGNLIAQGPPNDIARFIQNDSADVNTISMYTVGVRSDIFRVSMHPEGIAKLSDLQKKSNETFKSAVANYSRDEQEKIWDLTRYNGLINELAATDGKKKKIEAVLKNRPVEVHDNALDYATNNIGLIKNLDQMNRDFSDGFEKLIANYSDDDQLAFRGILKSPDALDLMSNNMRMTVLLGDLYKTDSLSLRNAFDSLNIVNTEQKAKDAKDWQKEMSENPDAKKEMQESAMVYASENGYKKYDNYSARPEQIVQYVFVPYPYWCGYPWWYNEPLWYPYPLWYHWGFYFWNGEMVWLGPPSWYFVNWHFHNHPHFYHYPHLTNAYINHYYYRPRHGVSQNSVVVNRWMRENERYFPRDFRSNSDQRIDRIREFGQSGTEIDRYNLYNPDKKINRDNFMKQHTNEYPHLKSDEIVQPAPAQDIQKSNAPSNINKNDAVKFDDNKEIKKENKDEIRNIKNDNENGNKNSIPSEKNKVNLDNGRDKEMPVKIEKPQQPVTIPQPSRQPAKSPEIKTSPAPSRNNTPPPTHDKGRGNKEQKK